jgi:hypothetical protein
LSRQSPGQGWAGHLKAKEAKPSPDVAVLERRLSEVERKLDQILKSQPEKRPAP